MCRGVCDGWIPCNGVWMDGVLGFGMARALHACTRVREGSTVSFVPRLVGAPWTSLVLCGTVSLTLTEFLPLLPSYREETPSLSPSLRDVCVVGWVSHWSRVSVRTVVTREHARAGVERREREKRWPTTRWCSCNSSTWCRK